MVVTRRREPILPLFIKREGERNCSSTPRTDKKRTQPFPLSLEREGAERLYHSNFEGRGGNETVGGPGQITSLGEGRENTPEEKKGRKISETIGSAPNLSKERDSCLLSGRPGEPRTGRWFFVRGGGSLSLS